MLLLSRLESFTICVFWSILIPQLNWIFLYFLIKASPWYRLLITAFWYSLISWSKHDSVSVGQNLLKLVAKVRNLEVIRETSTQPKHCKPAVFSLHPHGRFPLDVYAYFASDLYLSSVKIASASQGKFFPTIALTMALYGKTLDVTKSELIKELEHNRHVAIFPGGAKEMHECNPFGSEIRLVQHNGFLRLARASGAQVIPCFLFGVNEDYFSPFQKLQRTLYNFSKMSFPLWFPTSIMTEIGTNGLVTGNPIETSRFTTDGALITHYWSELQNLFENHKDKFKGYKYKTIRVISNDSVPTMNIGFDHRSTISAMKSYTETKYDSASGPKSLSPVLLSMLRFASFLNIIFLVATITFVILTGKWWKSSQGVIWEWTPSVLPLHVTSSLLWTICSALNFFALQTRLGHKIVGYLGALSMIGIVCTAILMQRESHISAKDKSANIIWNWTGSDERDLRLNSLIQTMSIFQVACMSFYLMTSALRAARCKRIQQHKETMSQIHLLMTDMFTPRISSFLLRSIIPMIGRDSIVTIASLIQWYRHVTVLTTRSKHLMPHNILSFALSSLMIVCCEHHFITYTPLIMVVIALFETPSVPHHTIQRNKQLEMTKRVSMVRKFREGHRFQRPALFE